MALEYKSVLGLESIMPVLDEYVVWYGRLVRSYFEGAPLGEEAPSVFSDWLTKAIIEKSINGDMADKIQAVHSDMVQAARNFTAHIAGRGAPPLQAYDDLNGHYEEFIHIMRRLEKDRAVENSGFDELTGLRSLRLMNEDVTREMERRSRQGNPFALALVKINNFRDEWRGDEEICRPMVRRISDEIKHCLRSFDDAYYLGDEYFLLALKHADILGSQAAMTRLNQGVLEANVQAPGDAIGEITVSSVVCEPTPGDSLEELVEHMKSDLDGIDAKGTILQYNELSPLQRYIHGMGKGK